MESAVLLVSPHLDDAVLSVGATISAMTAAGTHVVVCTVFAGRPQPPFSPAADDFHADCGLGWDAIDQRRQEDLAALAVLGAEAVHLDFLDAIYRRAGEEWLCQRPRAMFDSDLPPEQALMDDIARDVHCFYSRLEPSQVWTCAAVGGHVDHRLTRDATVTACPERHKILLWEDLPYAFESPPEPRTAAETPLAVESQTLQIKLDAIERYESQIHMLWPGGGWRALMVQQATARRHAGSFELLWSADSPSPEMPAAKPAGATGLPPPAAID